MPTITDLLNRTRGFRDKTGARAIPKNDFFDLVKDLIAKVQELFDRQASDFIGSVDLSGTPAVYPAVERGWWKIEKDVASVDGGDLNGMAVAAGGQLVCDGVGFSYVENPELATIGTIGAVSQKAAVAALFDRYLSPNILNPNYMQPSNAKEYEKGGDNMVVAESGSVIPATGWYTSSLIAWKENESVTMDQLRSWAQYDSDGVTVIGTYYPTSAATITFSRMGGATYFRVSVLMSSKQTRMANFGDSLLDFSEHNEMVKSNNLFLKQLPTREIQFKDYLLSESFSVDNPSYTAGIINSPVAVTYPDASTGSLDITRNSDGLVTKIIATNIKDGSTINLTVDITRDNEGNVINYSFY